jgi:GPH family glycoside/pentoside/hexuronide:cation symporter
LLVAGAAVFLPFPNANTIVKAVLFVLGYIVWDACYTIANVPYGSMLSLITEDTGERAQLSTWRSIGSMFGNIVPTILLPMLIWKKVTFDENADFLNHIEIPEGFDKSQFLVNPITKKAYEVGDAVLSPATGEQVEILLGQRVFWVALVMGVLGFICFQFMIRNTEVRIDTDVLVNDNKEKFNVLKAMGSFIKNRPAVGATIAAMGMFIGMQGAATAVSVTFQIYYKNPEISGIVQMFAMIPIVVFTPLARKMVIKYGKKELSMIGALCSIVGAAGLFIVTPNNTGLDLVVYILCQLVYSLGLGVYSTVSWAMMGDAIDYNEWKTGKREEGVVYSLHSFFRKLAQGIGPAVALIIMQGMGYVNNANLLPDGKTYTDALDAAGQYNVINVDWLSWEFAVELRALVAILYLVAGVMLFVGLGVIYNLDKKTLAVMNADLEARHAED